MKILCVILIILFSLFLTSCGALWSGGKRELPISNFSEISDITMLNGTYQNKINKEFQGNTFEKSKGKLSNIFHLPSDSIRSIYFEFGKKNVTMIFEVDSVLHKKTYKGKLKNNYFESTLKKKIIPIPFIYFIRQIEKVRIGRDEENNLLIHYWEDNLGWVIIGAAGSTYEFEYVFKKIEK
jgi:hypothetical protein